ncbi:Glycine dehydrogenase (decarboxylating) (glycine cleavage system P1 protein) [Microbacterium sp. 8M]|uniref:aminomethyl-transferring glycine dehydrogenase subunit GcvPA n=1 Tax=Microbacterium sp. 8M TaxID=2653153 RepID=UPI0012F417F1|nr:aminomethyl-transferring glycine dehydrogenase subunit GcvPA [Microbacterium sp. 8M]VXB46783.1 Glycine dehydrogenase (decarboxylating) (glycine cleavage system P1 protein) [Microbacterium sp. 8M]
MTQTFVHPYIPNTAPETRAAMLAETGAASIDEFYADVPEDLRLRTPLDLPEPLVAEQDLARHVRGLLARNRSTQERLSFLGAGTYNHYVPAVVDEVIGRSEFLTAYAGEPYEDHGRFQALFQYQSMMAELLEMDVVNVPVYDGYQATATGLTMSGRLTGRKRILVASDVLPAKLSKVRDYVRAHVELEIVPTVDGSADVEAVRAALGDDVAAVWIETPSATGVVEAALREIADAAHAAGAVVVVGTDPIGYGVLATPASQGADIVTGDIQSLGVHQWYGGGHGGFIAVHDEPRFVMQMPSRLFGLASTDVEGEYGFGDVAYDRTSFAHREEGKEWVGTAAALWGIAAGVYLALMGPAGMADLGELLLARTRYAQQRLAAIDGVRLTDSALHLREFAVELPVPAADVVAALRAQGIEPGVVTGERTLLVCVTEATGQSDIDRLAAALAAVVAPSPIPAEEQNRCDALSDNCKEETK